MNKHIAKRELKWLLYPGILVAAFLLVVIYFVFPSDAQPTEPQKIPCETTSCEAENWVPKRVNKFENDKLGNAKGISLPKSVQRRIAKKINAKYGAGTAKMSGPIDWFRENLKVTSCFINDPIGINRGTCDEGQRAVNRSTRETLKITVGCGGASAIGALGGGGWWGAGKGAGACFFALFHEAVF